MEPEEFNNKTSWREKFLWTLRNLTTGKNPGDMEQEKLEEKTAELFQEQGFDLEKTGNRIKAVKDDFELDLAVFSSEKYNAEEVEEETVKDEKIFVDEELRGVEEKVENEVSVLKEEENKDIEVPSYERIGDIVVVSELDGLSEERALEGILEHNPGIDSILLKDEKVSGEFRVGGYRKLYGEKTETVHREHGVRIKVDPTKMFFSEREGTERKRIFESVEKGEDILVMFSGAGPFPVTIARNSEAGKITGVEKNPEAVKLARKNLELNSVEDRVEIIEGDVREICPDLGRFDRVLMPSPTNALNFVDEALGCVKDSGVVVVYSISGKEDLYRPLVEAVRESAERSNLDVEVLEKRVVADFSPAKRKVAVEFRISREK